MEPKHHGLAAHRRNALALMLFSVAPGLAMAARPRRDFWQQLRRRFVIPPMVDERIGYHASQYAKFPNALLRALDRGRDHLNDILDSLDRRQLPGELALLPVIESGFDAAAMSTANAAGLWQLMPATARAYGIDIDASGDGRFQPKASTDAALDELTRLRQRFPDWFLALAAYNCGEGRVRDAMARSKQGGRSGAFLELDGLPAETRDYVPRLLAVKELIAHPSAYGLELPAMPFSALSSRMPRPFRSLRRAPMFRLAPRESAHGPLQARR
jgi:membrane-bound lytic murein transglycosylase D